METKPHRRYPLWIAAVAAAVIFLADILVELGVAIPLLYVVVVLLACRSGSERGVWTAAVGCTLLTLVGLFLSRSGGEPAKIIANRLLSASAVWIAAATCLHILTLQKQQAQRAKTAEDLAAESRRRQMEDHKQRRALQSVLEDLRHERERLAASESRLSATVDAAPTAMLMVDSGGRIVLANARANELFGYQPTELLGQAIEVLMPERFRAEHPNHRRDFLTSPAARPMGPGRDLYGLRKDGSEFPVSVGLSPFETEEGTFVLSGIVDITESKKLEEDQRKLNSELERRVKERTAELDEVNQALKNTNAELEQFAYIASHDLQEPLRKVSAFCELLQEEVGGELSGDANQYIGYVVDGARRMRALISDLLMYSRATRTGRQLVVTDSNAAWDEAVALMDFDPADGSVQITRDNLPHVLAEKVGLVQLFQNLISNALKYRSDATPVVHAAIAQRDGEWLFSVSDNGIGIEPQYLETIFVIFKRLHARDAYSGTGIGLAVCKKIVERLGGTIWAESKPGEGTTFYFTVPNEGVSSDVCISDENFATAD